MQNGSEKMNEMKTTKETNAAKLKKIEEMKLEILCPKCDEKDVSVDFTEDGPYVECNRCGNIIFATPPQEFTIEMKIIKLLFNEGGGSE